MNIENVKRLPYAVWKVKDIEYKLKLGTAEIVSLESYFKTSLLNLVEGMPALSTMLKITHVALSKYNHGITLKDVYSMFDDYCDEGGSQISFMTDVFVKIYQASGFFSSAQENMMNEKIQEAQEQLEQ